MVIQSMTLDPNAQPNDTGDQIITKINVASTQVTRASSVAAAARPIGTAEVTSTMMATTAAKDNLDAMTDTTRGYIKTAPTAGQFKVISIERQADGKAKVDYDDVAV